MFSMSPNFFPALVMYSRASLVLDKGSVIEHTHSLNAVKLEVLDKAWFTNMKGKTFYSSKHTAQ